MDGQHRNHHNSKVCFRTIPHTSTAMSYVVHKHLPAVGVPSFMGLSKVLPGARWHQQRAEPFGIQHPTSPTETTTNSINSQSHLQEGQDHNRQRLLLDKVLDPSRHHDHPVCALSNGDTTTSTNNPAQRQATYESCPEDMENIQNIKSHQFPGFIPNTRR